MQSGDASQKQGWQLGRKTYAGMGSGHYIHYSMVTGETVEETKAGRMG